ncbi:hypothetical protein HR51_21205 [Burkholderia cepacia]|nr:hypothetical protein HR51_21205 [Burkholderia cepacia]
MNVSVVGIGGIGLAIALRVAEAGYSVTGIDVSHGVRTTAERRSIPTTGRFALASWADTVIITAASPWPLEKIVEKVTSECAGQRWLVMSTLHPLELRMQAGRLVEAGISVVDAPATGDLTQAERGELQVFAAGDPANIEAVRCILEAVGNVNRVSEHVGDAQGMAIVNQYLSLVHVVAAAEALGLADRLGLDMPRVLEVLEKTGGGSKMLSDRGPRMLGPTNVKVTNTIDSCARACELVSKVAAVSGASVPLLAIAQSRYRQAAEAGLECRDDSRVIEVCSS